MRLESLTVLCLLGLTTPAEAWPTITVSPTAIHIELPAVHLPPLDAPSIHYHLHPQPLHFPPVDVNLPKELSAIHTPAELVEKVVYVSFSQYLPWASCTLAGSANDESLSKEQSEKCENAVYAQMKQVGIAALSAAHGEARDLNDAASKAGGDVVDARSMNEPAVEAVCRASSYAACEVVAPEACKSVLSQQPRGKQAAAASDHELSAAAKQAACENELIAGCATLVQAVCESSGQVVASLQAPAAKGGAK